jgi:hypothetical protein
MIKKIALATALVAALGLSLPAAAQQPFNLSLDGFCNTFALTINSWSIVGTRAGCGYTVIDGGAIVRVTGVTYRLTADTNDGSTLFTWFFTPPVRGHGNWYLYGSDGVTDTLFNSGTYTRTFAADAESNNGKKDVTADILKRH